MQNVRKSGSLTMPLDYGRWDRLPEDSDDDQLALTVESAPRLAESHPRAAEHLLERQRVYMTFLRWLREVAPELTESETTHLARFVAVQDRATCPEQRERHDAIAAFMEEKERWDPPLGALAELCREAEERRRRAKDPSAGRVLMLAMDALNTLAACKEEGGARVLFEAIRRDASGQVAERYGEFGYARPLAQARRDAAVAAASAAAEAEFTDPSELLKKRKKRSQPAVPWWRQLMREPLRLQSLLVALAVLAKTAYEHYCEHYATKTTG